MEQLHKIFKLCGSPSEDYWRKSKLPHATIFKPQQPYTRCFVETFKDFPPVALRLMETLLSVDPVDRGTAASALKSEVCFLKKWSFMWWKHVLDSTKVGSCSLTHTLSSSSLQQNHLLVILQLYPNILLAKSLMQRCGLKKLEGAYYLFFLTYFMGLCTVLSDISSFWYYKGSIQLQWFHVMHSIFGTNVWYQIIYLVYKESILISDMAL